LIEPVAGPKAAEMGVDFGYADGFSAGDQGVVPGDIAHGFSVVEAQGISVNREGNDIDILISRISAIAGADGILILHRVGGSMDDPGNPGS